MKLTYEELEAKLNESTYILKNRYLEIEVIESAKVFTEHVRNPQSKCSDYFTLLLNTLSALEKAKGNHEN